MALPEQGRALISLGWSRQHQRRITWHLLRIPALSPHRRPFCSDIIDSLTPALPRFHRTANKHFYSVIGNRIFPSEHFSLSLSSGKYLFFLIFFPNLQKTASNPNLLCLPPCLGSANELKPCPHTAHTTHAILKQYQITHPLFQATFL